VCYILAELLVISLVYYTNLGVSLLFRGAIQGRSGYCCPQIKNTWLYILDPQIWRKTFVNRCLKWVKCGWFTFHLVRFWLSCSIHALFQVHNKVHPDGQVLQKHHQSSVAFLRYITKTSGQYSIVVLFNIPTIEVPLSPVLVYIPDFFRTLCPWDSNVELFDIVRDS